MTLHAKMAMPGSQGYPLNFSRNKYELGFLFQKLIILNFVFSKHVLELSKFNNFKSKNLRYLPHH